MRKNTPGVASGAALMQCCNVTDLTLRGSPGLTFADGGGLLR
jgi:hypothetical protein